VNVPMLLLHGTGDTLVSIDGSRRLAELSGENVTYIEFTDSRHEIHHDFEREKEFDMISGYINDYIKRKL
jgi:alpha-beta hydrolase superfamily lysophospholipase